MLTFADYMNRLLYGPAGYYSTGTAKSGRAGDYFTAPDVGPVFGQLLAEIFAGWQARWNSEYFSITEVGAGEGRLAIDLLKSKPFRYAAVEKSLKRWDHLASLKPEFPTFEVYQDLSELAEQRSFSISLEFQIAQPEILLNHIMARLRMTSNRVIRSR